MAEIIIYLVKVSVCLIFLYGIYVFALNKETYFRFNRFYLLSAIIISFVIPLISIPLSGRNSETGFSYMLQSVQVIPEKIFVTGNATSVIYYIIIIYLAGFTFFSVRFLLRIISLFIIRHNCRIEKQDGLYIALCKNKMASFSFLNTIFIDESTIKDELSGNVVLHETIHIRQLHSIDILFSEIACIITWFNPASWLIKSALKETHEYLADYGVSKLTNNSSEYFRLLTKNIIGIQPALANNFNKSLTLKRLNMMKKRRSGRLSLLKALPVLPVAGLLFMAFSCSNSTDKMNSNESTDPGKNVTQQVSVDKMPQFPGGQEAMTKFIIENVKYPETAMKSGIQGKVLVSFTVIKSGKLDNIRVTQKVNDLLDAEAVRVVSSMPDWIPGENKGKTVDVEITLPISFKLQ